MFEIKLNGSHQILIQVEGDEIPSQICWRLPLGWSLGLSPRLVKLGYVWNFESK